MSVVRHTSHWALDGDRHGGTIDECRRCTKVQQLLADARAEAMREAAERGGEIS